MSLHEPLKEPSKCSIKLISILFSKEELDGGILFKSPRSSKPPFDSIRVKKMFGKWMQLRIYFHLRETDLRLMFKYDIKFVARYLAQTSIRYYGYRDFFMGSADVWHLRTR